MTVGALWAAGCKKTHLRRHATAASASDGLPEGIQTLRAEGWDIIGRYGARDSTVKVDRSSPTVSLGGRAYTERDDPLYEDEYGLQITAKDGVPGGSDSERRSGVKRVTVKDYPENGDARVLASPAIPDCGRPDSCGYDGAVTIKPYELKPGRHTIRVEVEDNAGNPETVKSFDVTVDWRTGRLRNYQFESQTRWATALSWGQFGQREPGALGQ